MPVVVGFHYRFSALKKKNWQIRIITNVTKLLREILPRISVNEASLKWANKNKTAWWIKIIKNAKTENILKPNFCKKRSCSPLIVFLGITIFSKLGFKKAIKTQEVEWNPILPEKISSKSPKKNANKSRNHLGVICGKQI